MRFASVNTRMFRDYVLTTEKQQKDRQSPGSCEV